MPSLNSQKFKKDAAEKFNGKNQNSPDTAPQEPVKFSNPSVDWFQQKNGRPIDEKHPYRGVAYQISASAGKRGQAGPKNFYVPT